MYILFFTNFFSPFLCIFPFLFPPFFFFFLFFFNELRRTAPTRYEMKFRSTVRTVHCRWKWRLGFDVNVKLYLYILGWG